MLLFLLSGCLISWEGFENDTGGAVLDVYDTDTDTDTDAAADTDSHDTAPPEDTQGTDSSTDSEAPLVFTQVSAGGYHSCALDSVGGVTCWGDDTKGQLTDAPEETGYFDIASGAYHSCALNKAERVVCWGDDEFAQTTIPTLLQSRHFSHVSVSEKYSCALDKSSGEPHCWGEDDRLQVSGAPSLELTALSAGYGFTCGLDGGDLSCWGDVLFEEEAYNAPTYTSLSVGRWHGCSISSTDELTCWEGSGDEYGAVSEAPSAPVDSVSSGNDYSCAVDNSSGILCWGRDVDGAVTAKPSTTGFEAISAGFYHACALDSAGAITCWGKNTQNQAPTTPFTPG